MQPAGKRRPGEQLTKDNCDDSDDGDQVDAGTWGKADAATMARRKVVKVRRGAAADQPTTAAAPAADGNPFAGASLAAAAPSANPFAGVSLAAAVGKTGPEQAATDQAGASAAAGDKATTASGDAATEAPADNKKADAPEAAAAADEKKAADQDTPPAAAEGTTDKQTNKEEKQDEQTAADKAEGNGDDKAAASSGTGSLFGSAGTTGFGGFGGFGGLAGGTTSFGAGGFGGFAAAAKDGSSGGSLFGSYTAPQPGSMFGSFGAAGASKAKDVEEGGGDGEGEDGGEENGKELFGGPEVTPVVQLNEVPKQTGEEEENSVFTAEGKLFEFVDGKEWKERGRGDLRLNIHRSSHRARLVMRQKGSQRLLLNANLFPTMIPSKMVGGKGATFMAVNAAPPVPSEQQGKAEKQEEGAADAAATPAAAPSLKTYAFKAKSAEIDAFLDAVNKYKDGSQDDAADAAEGSKQANPDSW